MRLIDADELRKQMYHEAFETDTDMQRWDGGCWIRYWMFENAIESAPTIDPVKHGRWIEHHEPFTWMGYTTWTCSVCGYECGYEKEIGFRTSCCPQCGASMDEVEE